MQLTQYGQRPIPRDWAAYLAAAKALVGPHLDALHQNLLPVATDANTADPATMGLTYSDLDRDRDAVLRKLLDAARELERWAVALQGRTRPTLPAMTGAVEVDLTSLEAHIGRMLEFAQAQVEAEPLTTRGEIVYQEILNHQPIMGSSLVLKTGIDQSTLTKEVIPELKRLRGVANKPGAGYWVPGSYRPQRTP